MTLKIRGHCFIHGNYERIDFVMRCPECQLKRKSTWEEWGNEKPANSGSVDGPDDADGN